MPWFDQDSVIRPEGLRPLLISLIFLVLTNTRGRLATQSLDDAEEWADKVLARISNAG